MDAPEGFTGLEESICLEHVLDDALRELLIASVEEVSCSYCHRTGEIGEVPFAVSMDLVGRQVFEAATWLFHDGVDEFFHEGYPFQYNTHEVVAEVTDGAFDWTIWDEVVEHIADAIASPEWWVTGQLHEEFIFSWESFAEAVKHESRFVYFGAQDRPGRQNEPPARVSQFLEGLSSYIRDEMITVLEPASTVFRARMVEHGDLIRQSMIDPARNLGPAPPGIASAGRLNAEGVGLFYGATTAQLAVQETALHSRFDEALVGAFKVARPLTILDFSKRPDLPSVFDETRRREFLFSRFADDFVERITQSVPLTGSERIEYVVTQVIAEYFRWAPARILDGIAWESHLLQEGESGKNILIWAGSEDVRSDPPPPGEPSESVLWRRAFGAPAPFLTLSAHQVSRHLVRRFVQTTLVGWAGEVEDGDPMFLGS